MTRSPRAAALCALAIALAAPAPSGAAEPTTAPIARLSLAAGEVAVKSRDDQDWRAAAKGAPLKRADVVRTGKDSIARIEMEDGKESTPPTRVDLIPETEVSLNDLVLEDGLPPRRRGFLGLISGAVRTITHGWGARSLFSVKSGTTICGIRGSEAFQDDKTLVVLNGDIFKMHWTGEEGLEEALRELTELEALPGNHRGAHVKQLQPGYVGVFQEDARGKVIAREVILAPEAFAALQESFRNWSAALDSAEAFDVSALHAPLKKLLDEAVAQALESEAVLVSAGGGGSRIDSLLDRMRKRQRQRMTPVDRYEDLRKRTDDLEATLEEMEDATNKGAALDELEDMLDELEALEAELTKE